MNINKNVNMHYYDVYPYPYIVLYDEIPIYDILYFHKIYECTIYIQSNDGTRKIANIEYIFDKLYNEHTYSQNDAIEYLINNKLWPSNITGILDQYIVTLSYQLKYTLLDSYNILKQYYSYGKHINDIIYDYLKDYQKDVDDMIIIDI